MNQNQRTKKAEQLRLAAQIIETGAEWEIERIGMGWLDSRHLQNCQWGCPLDAINHGFPIRIKEPVILVPEGWRELSDDEKDGRWIEGAKWLSPVEMWKHCTSTKGQSNDGAYANEWNRIIVPVTKPKKRVPLGPEDVVPGSALRPIERPDAVRDCWAAVISTGEVGVQAVRRGDIEGYSYHDLMSEFEIKRPTDTEWQPCWKEAS